MAANPHGSNPPPCNRSEAFNNLPLTFKDSFCFLLQCLWQVIQAAAQELEDLSGQAAHGLVQGTLIVHREGFRGEIGFVGGRGKGDV